MSVITVAVGTVITWQSGLGCFYRVLNAWATPFEPNFLCSQTDAKQLFSRCTIFKAAWLGFVFGTAEQTQNLPLASFRSVARLNAAFCVLNC